MFLKYINRSPDVPEPAGAGDAAVADPPGNEEGIGEHFGDPIQAADQIPAGSADDGASGADAVGDLPQETPPAQPAGFMEQPWPSEATLPEGLEQYDTPGKAMQAIADGKIKINDQGKELSKARADNKLLRDGNINEANAQLWDQAQEEIGNVGGITLDTAEKLAPLAGMPPQMLMVIGGLIRRQTDLFNADLGTMLGGEAQAKAFIDQLPSSGLFSQAQLDLWNAQATEGDTSWVGFAARKLGLTVVAQASSAAPAEPALGERRPAQVQTGEPAPAPKGPDVFTSRPEYLDAQAKAQAHYENSGGDDSKIMEVKAKLQRSDMSTWGNVYGG